MFSGCSPKELAMIQRRAVLTGMARQLREANATMTLDEPLAALG